MVASHRLRRSLVWLCAISLALPATAEAHGLVDKADLPIHMENMTKKGGRET